MIQQQTNLKAIMELEQSFLHNKMNKKAVAAVGMITFCFIILLSITLVSCFMAFKYAFENDKLELENRYLNVSKENYKARLMSRITAKFTNTNFVNSIEETNREIIKIQQTEIDRLNSLYANEEMEFGQCYKMDSNGIMQPINGITHFRNETSIQLQCPTDSDMHLHSHPSGSCYLSESDVKCFMQVKHLGYEDYQYFDYMAVICGNGSFHIKNATLDLVDIMVIQ